MSHAGRLFLQNGYPQTGAFVAETLPQLSLNPFLGPLVRKLPSPASLC